MTCSKRCKKCNKVKRKSPCHGKPCRKPKKPHYKCDPCGKNRKPLVAKSGECGSLSGSEKICKHECVDHAYNFEAICGQGVPDPFPDCKGNIDLYRNENFESLTVVNGGGVKKLGCYVKIDPQDLSEANKYVMQACGLNVNPCGFSVSVWFNLEEIDDGDLLKNDDSRFFSKATGTDADDHIVMGGIASGPTQKLRFRLKTDSSPNTTTLEEDINPPLMPKTWHHAVFWYDGCEMRMYLDGTMIASVSKTGKVIQNDVKTGVGSQPKNAGSGGSHKVLNGCLDQLVFWNAPLADSTITELYNSGCGTKEITNIDCTSTADFGKACGCCDKLTSFSQTLCITTCGDFCDCLLTGCERLTVLVEDKCGKGKRKDKCILAYKINDLSEWPGDVEVLDKAENTTDANKTDYVIKLSLCVEKLFGCPISMNDKQVRLIVENQHNIQDVKPFVITGVRTC